MTSEEAARFVLSDCQDPELRALADRDAEAAFAHAMRDPAFAARWRALFDRWAEELDAHIVAEVLKEIRSS